MREFESPSSINLYLLCPRKYYYRYIKNLVPPEDIILLRGKILHKVVEDFFKIKELSNNYEFEFKIVVLDLFNKNWQENLSIIKSFNLDDNVLKSYYEESKEMLLNWVGYLNNKIKQTNLEPNQAFSMLRGEREVTLFSPLLGVRGILDAIYEDKIVDYKTSARDTITEDYRVQLGIYSLLFFEKFKRLPKSASLYFFKFGEKEIMINEDLVEETKEKILFVKSKTITEDKEDYPKNVGKYCKWSTGKCPYFDLCFPEN